jgi:predicted ester cyclase
MEHRGHDGVRESVGLYKRIFDDLSFTTEQQVAEGDRVVNALDSPRLLPRLAGRVVGGVVNSRFEDGRIAEDWAFSDIFEVAKQLGVSRSALIVMKEWRALLE